MKIPKRANKGWSKIQTSCGGGKCMDCKRETYNLIHISRYKICGDCAYRRMFKELKKQKGDL